MSNCGGRTNVRLCPGDRTPDTVGKKKIKNFSKTY